MLGETCTPEQLLKRLDTLLGDETSCSWADVLATAMALREKAVIKPEAADLVHALDTKVISKAYVEQGRPDLAAAVLESALSRTGATWQVAQAAADEVQELHLRRLLNICYQACAASPMHGSGSCCCSSSSSPSQQFCNGSANQQPISNSLTAHVQPGGQQEQQQRQQQQDCSLHQLCDHHHSQQQQQQQAASIANSQRMLQLAAALSDHQQQAQAAGDLAALYTASADASNACRMYAECMQACSAAVAGARICAVGSFSWVPELLIAVVPAAVDAHLTQGDAAGARTCLTTYNTLLLAAGKSACEECAVCYEPLTGSSAVTLLGCGHIFHRACCNEWFGHKLFEAGRFQPECPLCRQVDESLQPSETALAALQEIQQYYCEHSQEEEDEASEEEVQSEDEAGEDADLLSEGEQEEECEKDGSGSDDVSDVSEGESDDGCSDNDNSDDDDSMEVDSEVGSSVASSALTAVAAQLADAAALENATGVGSDT